MNVEMRHPETGESKTVRRVEFSDGSVWICPHQTIAFSVYRGNKFVMVSEMCLTKAERERFGLK